MLHNKEGISANGTGGFTSVFNNKRVQDESMDFDDIINQNDSSRVGLVGNTTTHRNQNNLNGSYKSGDEFENNFRNSERFKVVP